MYIYDQHLNLFLEKNEKKKETHNQYAPWLSYALGSASNSIFPHNGNDIQDYSRERKLI